MLFRWCLVLLAAWMVSGCTSVQPRNGAASRRFEFAKDTFSFTNQLVWTYHINPETGEQSWSKRDAKPDYSLRCFVMVKRAKQFWWHARFDPALPRVDDSELRRRIRAVVRRRDSGESSKEPVIIPGYASLRELSALHPKLLQEESGGAWQSYFQRGHWRMILPFGRSGQEKVAADLKAKASIGTPHVVHVVRFPSLKINHALLIYGVEAAGSLTRFHAYDPNTPQKPIELIFDPAKRTFEMKPNDYFAGGRVDVYEVYRNFFY